MRLKFRTTSLLPLHHTAADCTDWYFVVGMQKITHVPLGAKESPSAEQLEVQTKGASVTNVCVMAGTANIRLNRTETAGVEW
ncbi:hypothetical protein SCLCIDRAFT_1213604 [Scleroderma citrinum Foug A]|uniref:Uncharacterized protein n=1 Tax=Scleroderma citrinum Foug A TaxID=1036808 RepID=A0A0C3DU91_9AGAM|nr:hypothetical protein SCLCIDRAFT_1213604 [Scleroderma citrinum Foug A]